MLQALPSTESRPLAVPQGAHHGNPYQGPMKDGPRALFVAGHGQTGPRHRLSLWSRQMRGAYLDVPDLMPGRDPVGPARTRGIKRHTPGGLFGMPIDDERRRLNADAAGGRDCGLTSSCAHGRLANRNGRRRPRPYPRDDTLTAASGGPRTSARGNATPLAVPYPGAGRDRTSCGL